MTRKNKRGNGEGSIYRRPNGKWRAQISVAGRRLSHQADTQYECQLWVRQKLGEIDGGLDYRGGELTVAAYLARWIDTAAVALRDKTALQYRRAIANYINPHIGQMRLLELRLDRIEQFYARLGQEGRGVRTIRIVHNILHKAFEQAVRYNYIVRNPTQGAILPRYRQQEMQVLDEGEVSRLLVTAQGSPYETFFRLAVMTGMRLGELMGLRWADLSWQHGTLHVQRQVQRVDGQGWQYVEPKTRASRRIVPLSSQMLMALRAHQKQQKLQRELKGARWDENGLIFTNSVGNPLDASNMRKEFNRVLAAAGLPRVRFHDLRHTAASLMLNNHVPLIVAARMLGHQRPSVTLDIYGHLYHDKQSQAAEILEGLVGPTSVALPERAEVIIDVE